MDNKKYELMPKEANGLHRIRALRSFGDVKAGDLGGFIGSEHNLSHYGLCWILEDAQVFGGAQVSENARVHGNAQVSGDALVYGNARVFENARVYENARVCGSTQVFGGALVYGNAVVFGDAQVYGNARVSENAQVSDNAQVSGSAQVYGDARVFEKALVQENARVYGDAHVSGSIRLDRPSKLMTNIIGSRYPVTILDTVVHIGCKVMTTKEWIEKYREIVAEEGFTPEQIEEYLVYLRMAEALQGLNNAKRND